MHDKWSKNSSKIPKQIETNIRFFCFLFIIILKHARKRYLNRHIEKIWVFKVQQQILKYWKSTLFNWWVYSIFLLFLACTDIYTIGQKMDTLIIILIEKKTLNRGVLVSHPLFHIYKREIYLIWLDDRL